MKYIKTINEMSDDDGYEDREGYEIINKDEYTSYFTSDPKRKIHKFTNKEISEIKKITKRIFNKFCKSVNEDRVITLIQKRLSLTICCLEDEYYLSLYRELIYDEYNGSDKWEETYFICDQMTGLENMMDEIESRYLFQKRIQSDNL